MSKITHTQRAEWVKALRSGDYQQGKGTLKRTATFLGEVEERKASPEYCCLGVYAEIYGEAKRETYGETSYIFPKVGDDVGSTVDINTDVISRSAQNFLMGLNDSGEYTFAQIADIIERLPMSFLRNGAMPDKDDDF